jgi:hypothetical protein
MIISIIGGTAIVLSLIVPYFIKNKQTGNFIGAILAAFACGLFLGELIIKHYS